MNLAQSLLAACERHPELEAFPGITYGELLPRVRRIAGGLGVAPGDRVATVLDNRLETALVYWAAQWAGAVFVPLNEPVKPQVVEAPAASFPFQAAFLAVTVLPEVVTVALQVLVKLCPLGQVQVTVHALIAALPALTVTAPWKPPGQEPVTA